MLRLTALALLLAAAPAAAAPGFQNIDALEARLTGALGAGIGETGGPAAPIDRRLKLAACPATVAIEPPALGAVTLACPALGWRIRVPLRRLEQQAVGSAPATARAQAVIKRGDPVELVAERDGFTVSTQTVAQEDGVPGGRIRLRADSKAPVVIAEVTDFGRARIP